MKRFLRFFAVITPLVFLSLPFFTHAAVINRSATTNITNGLIGRWTFDGKDMPSGRVNDVSGNGRTGYTQNISTSTFYSQGKIGQGARFDGIDDGVNMGNITAYEGITNFSTGGWYKVARVDSSQAFTGKFNGNFNNGPYILWYSGVSETLIFYVFKDAGTFGAGQYPLSLANYVDGKWHHIMGTYDGTNVRIYLDGVLGVTVGSVTGATYTGSGNNVLIGRTDTGNDYFNGWLDDFRFYNRTLSQAEIQAIVAEGQAKQAVSPINAQKNGLVGYWTMDGKDIVNGVVKDKSGNGNDANHTNIASSTFYKAGKIGQGLNFDGVDDYVVGTDMTTLEGATRATWSVWFNPASLGNDRTIFGKWSSNGSNDSFIMVQPPSGLGMGNDDIALYLFNTGTVGYTTTNTIAANKWYHAVWVYDGTQSTNATKLKLYLNGVEIPLSFVSTIPTSLPATGSNLTIGGVAAPTPGSYFAGTIDDLRIYNRALSATEALQLYNEGQGKQAVSPVDALKNGLVGYWTFDGKDMPSGRALDKSGNNRTGYGSTGFSTSTMYTQGKIGQGLSFGKPNAFIHIPTGSTLTLPYSASLWFYQYPITPTAQAFLAYGLSDAGHAIYYDGNGTITTTSYSSGSFRRFCYPTVTTNKWYHLVIVVNSSTDNSLWKCYINGVEVTAGDSDNSGTYSNPGTTDWTIGAYYNNSYWFNGKIDDVRIYNRGLSASEVLQLYNMGK